MAKSEHKYRPKIVEIGRLLHEKGFVAATDGNISVRLDAKRIMATPRNVSKGMLRPEDMIIVDRKGNKISGQRHASSELPMHLLIYELRPDVQAVVHAHPPTATGYAAAGLSLDKALLPEVVLALGSVPLARYGTPGTPELCDALRNLIPHFNAILMANHGVVTFGEDLLKAYFNMETVEHFARISLVTKLLGKQVLLSSEEVRKLMDARRLLAGKQGGKPCDVLLREGHKSSCSGAIPGKDFERMRYPKHAHRFEDHLWPI